MGFELNRLQQLEHKARMVVSTYPTAYPKYHKIFTRLLISEDFDGEYGKITSELEREKRKIESSRVLSLIAKSELKIWELRSHVDEQQKKLNQKKTILNDIAPTSFRVKYLLAKFEERRSEKRSTSEVSRDVQRIIKRRKEYKYQADLFSIPMTSTTKPVSNRPLHDYHFDASYPVSQSLNNFHYQPQVSPVLSHITETDCAKQTDTTRTDPQLADFIQPESQPNESVRALLPNPTLLQANDIHNSTNVTIVEHIEKYWSANSRPKWRTELNFSPYKFL